MKVKAGRYLRISSDPKGLRAGVQRQDVDTLTLTEREGWDDGGIYCDNDVSATSGKRRPEFERLLADMESGKISAIVAYAPDRLTRQPKELEELVALVERTGCRVLFCTAGEYRLDTADGRFHARMLGTVARMEAEKLSERVRRAKLQSAEAGKWSGGGKRPYGFEPDGETVRESEAEIVREMARRYLAGELLGTIASDLTARNLPTSFGGMWNKTTLRQILQSTRLIGLRTHKGATYPARWPALISQDDWDTIQARLATGTNGRPTSSRTYLLTGFLFCGHEACGKALTSQKTAKGVKRYSCPVPTRGGCGGISITAEPLEKYVRAKVKEYGAGRSAPTGLIAARLAKIRASQERLESLEHAHYVEGKWADNPGQFEKFRAQLERQISEAQDALDLPAPVALTATEETLEGRRQRIQSVVDKIVILPAVRKGGSGLDTNRVNIHWK